MELRLRIIFRQDRWLFPTLSSRAQREIFPNPNPCREEGFLSSFEMTKWRRTFTVVLASIAYVLSLSTVNLHAAEKLEKLRAAYPAVAPGSTPSWVTAEKRIWQKYGLEVEPILVSGGARAVPALLGQSVQFLFGSDTGITTAQLQGIPVVRLGVTMNTLGSSLLTQRSEERRVGKRSEWRRATTSDDQ